MGASGEAPGHFLWSREKQATRQRPPASRHNPSVKLPAIRMAAAAVRASLTDSLLSSASLDFGVGGGVMCYSNPREALPADLETIDAAKLGLSGGSVGTEAAQVMVALVLIARGALDAAHDIVGGLSSAEATWAHAIIHRREGRAAGEAGLPGYSNSRYWFGCLGAHELFPLVQEFVAAHPVAPRGLKAQSEWDPAKFIGLCDRSERSGSDVGIAFCVDVQRREWELLYDHCAKLAGCEE